MIEGKYLELLLDDDTQLIQEDIPDVLGYLFDLYGKVPSKEVKQKEAEIRTMVYHPAEPMIYSSVQSKSSRKWPL